MVLVIIQVMLVFLTSMTLSQREFVKCHRILLQAVQIMEVVVVASAAVVEVAAVFRETVKSMFWIKGL